MSLSYSFLRSHNNLNCLLSVFLLVFLFFVPPFTTSRRYVFFPSLFIYSSIILVSCVYPPSVSLRFVLPVRLLDSHCFLFVFWLGKAECWDLAQMYLISVSWNWNWKVNSWVWVVTSIHSITDIHQLMRKYIGSILMSNFSLIQAIGTGYRLLVVVPLTMWNCNRFTTPFQIQ